MTLILFASSYSCETGFFALKVITTKFSVRLNTEKEIRILSYYATKTSTVAYFQFLFFWREVLKNITIGYRNVAM